MAEADSAELDLAEAAGREPGSRPAYLAVPGAALEERLLGDAARRAWRRAAALRERLEQVKAARRGGATAATGAGTGAGAGAGAGPAGPSGRRGGSGDPDPPPLPPLAALAVRARREHKRWAARLADARCAALSAEVDAIRSEIDTATTYRAHASAFVGFAPPAAQAEALRALGADGAGRIACDFDPSRPGGEGVEPRFLLTPDEVGTLLGLPPERIPAPVAVGGDGWEDGRGGAGAEAAGEDGVADAPMATAGNDEDGG